MRFFPFGCISDRFAIARKRAKLVQLMQKFVPRCLVRIFHTEHSRSIPLDPNLMFRCVSFRLGAFGTVSLLHETWCKMRQTGAFNVKIRATKSCHNFSQRTLTIHNIGPYKLMFWCVSYHLDAFGIVRLPYKTRGKTF